ncbi:hypothetical protein [Opitutus sp. ER46]|uniref:hypothetical protein n=1 Tax=Opitutus sp. ER46 TaxID=2161864 RepID=UPI000D303E2C|nr:hypothetical protein [Opitutus sp. ER46]PTY00117.1 hypothetical protein DB354_02180 [Opitutus sp. ER46]
MSGYFRVVSGALVFARGENKGALQLLVMGRFLDVAVRDIVIALSGPLVLARLTSLVFDRGHAAANRHD